ncbi:hypothetical protein [Viridibacillus arvi]|uniref:hypothetical protein n=1 Tax=Viridibacillus arvi TaxID=263475 RepID=UPI0034CE3185
MRENGPFCVSVEKFRSHIIAVQTAKVVINKKAKNTTTYYAMKKANDKNAQSGIYRNVFILDNFVFYTF